MRQMFGADMASGVLTVLPGLQFEVWVGGGRPTGGNVRGEFADFHGGDLSDLLEDGFRISGRVFHTSLAY